MKKSIVAVLIILAIVSGMAFTLSKNKKEIDSKNVVKTTNENIAVTIAKAQTLKIDNSMEFTGQSQPNMEVIVAAECSGKITGVNFKLGDFVAKGTVLAQVDDTYKRLAYETAQLNYNKYKEDYQRYQILQQGNAIADNQVREMRSAYENASIQLENAKKQLDDTRILAPFSGVIISKNTEMGAYVNPGSPVAGIADVAQLKIALSVSESDVYLLKKGQSVSATTNVCPATFDGKISGISPKGSSVHTYPVEIQINNTEGSTLKAGTFMTVTIAPGEPDSALLIPREAIITSIKDPSVYVVDGDIVRLTGIKTGRDYKSYVEVTDGLLENDNVVTKGQINLKDGASISIID